MLVAPQIEDDRSRQGCWSRMLTCHRERERGSGNCHDKVLIVTKPLVDDLEIVSTKETFRGLVSRSQGGVAHIRAFASFPYSSSGVSFRLLAQRFVTEAAPNRSLCSLDVQRALLAQGLLLEWALIRRTRLIRLPRSLIRPMDRSTCVIAEWLL